MRKTWPTIFVTVALGLIFGGPLSAQNRHDDDRFHDGHRATIKFFSVDVPDITLSYPSYLTGVDFPDEHTSFLPLWSWGGPWTEPGLPKYLLFTTSAVTPSGASGAVVLESSDLINFDPATDLGYSEQSLTSPVVFGTCDGTHDQEFDENYAGPGSVLQESDASSR